MIASCSEPGGNPLVAIAIGPSSVEIVEGGTTAQLAATGTYADGTTRDLTSSVAWTSSDRAVASVEPSGLLYAGWAGPVTVGASADGVSGSKTLRVAGFAHLGVTFLDAPDGYLDNPVAVLDGRGAALVAYGVNDLTSRPLTTRAAGPAWPPAWIEQDDAIDDAWQTSAADVQLAANASGVAGMVYRTSSRSSFGVAYRDGAGWSWHVPWQGALSASLSQDDSAGTPTVAVDPAGTLFVAYQASTATYPLDELTVARFDVSGLVDVTTWPEYVAELYVAASPSGKVMVVNGWTGSRLFDGVAWGALEPLPARAGLGGRLFLDDDGGAALFGTDATVWVSRRGPVGWSQPETLSDVASVVDASVARDPAGREVVAWAAPVGGGYEVVARVFDGTSWSARRVLETTAPPDGCCGTSLDTVDVLTDDAGRFVVLWYRGSALRATWFDGSWHTAVGLGPGGVFAPQAMMRPDGLFTVISDREVYNSLYSSTYALQP